MHIVAIDFLTLLSHGNHCRPHALCEQFEHIAWLGDKEIAHRFGLCRACAKEKE